MNRKVTIAASSLAVCSGLLVACGNSNSVGPVASTGGAATVTVDGKDLPGLDVNSVSCVKAAGRITVGSAAIGGQQGVGVVMTDANPPAVQSLGIVYNGAALAVAPGAGSADVKVDGSTYTISGTAQGTNLNNPTAGLVSKPFEIKVHCT